MTNKTLQLLKEVENAEQNFYATIVPNLVTEISNSHKQNQQLVLELNKTKQEIQRLYNDYQDCLQERYKLAKSKDYWKLSFCISSAIFVALIAIGLFFGAI